jgi:hypothetical protein
MTDKNPHAVALGKLGGTVRLAKISPERRKEIAAMGGRATKGIKKPRKNAVDAVLPQKTI